MITIVIHFYNDSWLPGQLIDVQTFVHKQLLLHQTLVGILIHEEEANSGLCFYWLKLEIVLQYIILTRNFHNLGLCDNIDTPIILIVDIVLW